MSVSDTHTADTTEASRTEQRIELANSVVELRRTPIGVVGYVFHDSGRTAYAGPLTDATIAALREVGR